MKCRSLLFFVAWLVQVCLLASCSHSVPADSDGSNPVIAGGNSSGIDNAPEQPADVPTVGASSGALGLELPAFNENYLQVEHYTDCDNKHVLNYTLEWVPKFRHANWVAFRWDAYTAQNNVSRNDKWMWDPLIPTSDGVVSESNHKSDGYDKGHLVSSGDRTYCGDANAQTFYYSNISPQMSAFNNGFWNSLELLLRDWGRDVVGTADTMYVVKGGNLSQLYINFTGTVKSNDGIIPKTDANGFSPKGLAVPAYYFMGLLYNKGGKYSAIGFYVPHDATLPNLPTTAELQKYAVSIDALEKATGLDLFHNLPAGVESEVESTLQLDSWKW